MSKGIFTPMTPPALAIFDLDNTLLEGDCENLWCQFLYEHQVVDRSFIDGIEASYREYEAGTMDYPAYVEFFLRPLTALAPAELERLQSEYLAEIPPLVRPALRAEADRHRAEGHVLLMISASHHFLVEPIAALMRFDNVICTQAEVVAGRLTGRLAAPSPFREGKVLQLENWIAQRGYNLQGSWSYSDSINDLPLLACTDHPVAVTPDPLLRQVAEEKGWRVIG
jgi:HAD superfamily hydrolase (TIGR01490 family)